MRVKDIKKEALLLLRNHWGMAFIALILIFAASFACQMLFDSIVTTLALTTLNYYSALIFVLILSVIVYTIPYFLQIGNLFIYLDLKDKGKFEIAGLFELFNSKGIKYFGLILVQNIFIFLWTLLFIIPGIIKSYSYSQSLYIMRDNPDIGILEAITQSRKMMDGHKVRYFWLILSINFIILIPLIIIIIMFGNFYYNPEHFSISFIFVFFLFISIVALSFYVVPYLSSACAVFYRDLTTNSDENISASDNINNNIDVIEDSNPNI